MGIKPKPTKNGDHESLYAIGDVVLAKIRGYPAWPGLVSSLPVACRVSTALCPFSLFHPPDRGSRDRAVRRPERTSNFQKI
jgi:hypothetical protein